MRDRHWKMLMQATGKQFVMDARFCLGDLLALELHNYVDACSEIVDRYVRGPTFQLLRKAKGQRCHQTLARARFMKPSKEQDSGSRIQGMERRRFSNLMKAIHHHNRGY